MSSVVGREAFQRVQIERTSFFTRLAETAKRSDVPNAATSVVVARNFKLVRKIAHGCNGIVYEAKCIGEGHPEFFRDQSYVLKVPFNYWGVRTSSVSNAFENEYLVSSTLDAHPNVNQYFCHFTDRPPQEYFDLLPPVPKESAFDPVRQRIHACVWIVLEYHSETLDHFLKQLNQPTGTQQQALTTATTTTTTPWCVVHKYSRDICAALVHLFRNRTIHFDMKLDNIVVSSQPSFELGCILFELAMGGQHPLPGYPAAYGPTGQVDFSVQSEEQFPMRPPEFPRELCHIVRGLLECDPAKRIPLLDASKLLETVVPDPSPQEQLSFYTLLEPMANRDNDDPGRLTAKALCQILHGHSTKDCCDTLHRALDVEPLFSPALLILHYLLSSGASASAVHGSGVARKGIRAAVSGKASFTHTDLEFERAINQSHRTTLPELVLTALRMRHICNIGCVDGDDNDSSNSNAIKDCVGLIQGKVTTTTTSVEVTTTTTRPERSAPSSSDLSFPASNFLRNIIESCSEKDCCKRMWSDHLTICTYEQLEFPRSKIMLEALFEFEQVNIEAAIHLVSDAFKQFESCRTNNRTSASRIQVQVQEELCYLPGLLFLYGLRFFADDHVALHQLIPPNLSSAFSRAISSSIPEMRDYCRRVLLLAANSVLVTPPPLMPQTQQVHEEKKAEETVMSVAQEWDELIALVSAMSDFGDPPAKGWGRQGACQYFVALWTACCCLEKTTSCGLPQIVGCCVTHNEPTTLWWASTMSLVGACFVAGTAVDRDTSKAASLFRRASDAGNASAMNSLGWCHKNGSGVEKDMNEAVSLFRKAADAGCAEAMINLGLCYYNGNGVEKDMNQAVSLYRKAADAGDSDAMFNLGLCYKNGNDVDKDMNEAVSLFRKAADAGSANAMNSLGLCYQNGNGVEKDMNQAVSLYRKAADAGNIIAMYNLGLCYENGNGVEKDMNQAVSLYRRAADAGNILAMNNLGLCYENGNGVEKDMNQAVSLFRKAADAGCAKAMNNLGWCYHNGNGVEKDMNEAVSLFRRAADAGSADAMCNLGSCYKYGNGVKMDVGVANTFYRRAAAEGCLAAQALLKPTQTS
ncbi:sel1 repeat family protein [Pelomyxa schiedti]|nr:sel1 repeat family protein [Pelomyxa schiedti]